MDLKKIGKYIQTKRKELGLTQAELAERLGMSNKSVSKWERGVCLPDVSIYMELCEILGVSLNEFIAGEDLSEDRIIEKSEANIVEVTKNELIKRKKLKRIILALSLMVVVALGSLSYYLYPVLFPRTNYLEPMPEDSKEVELAKTWFGIGKAYLYNYSIDDTYESVAINLAAYKKGELTYKETVAEFPLVAETKEGFIAVFHDYLDDEAKIMVGGEDVSGSVEFDMFEELEEVIGGSSQSRYTIAEIEHGKEVGLAAFYFEDEILRGIREAKDLDEYNSLSDAAYLRAKEDYLIGINFSRLLSLIYARGLAKKMEEDRAVISIGRVMTCVLGLVVNREREIRNFKKVSFYKIRGAFQKEDIPMYVQQDWTEVYVQSVRRLGGGWRYM